MENKIQKILDKYSDVSIDPKLLKNTEEELIPLLFSKVSQIPELVLKSSQPFNKNSCFPNIVLDDNLIIKENIYPKILYSISQDDTSSPKISTTPQSESIQEKLKSIIKGKKFINYSPKKENLNSEWCIIDEKYSGPFTDEELLKKIEDYRENKNKNKKSFILYDKKMNEYMTIDTCYDLLKNKLDPKNNNIPNKNKTDFDCIRQNINKDLYNRNLLYIANVNNMYIRMNNEIKRRYLMNQMNSLMNKQLFIQNLPLGMSLLNEMYIKQKQILANNKNKDNNKTISNNANKDKNKNNKAKKNKEKNDINKNLNYKNNYEQNNNSNIKKKHERFNHSYCKQNYNNKINFYNYNNRQNINNEDYNKNNNNFNYNKNNYKNHYVNYNTNNYNNIYLNKNKNFNINNNYNNNSNYNNNGNNYNNNYINNYNNNYNNNYYHKNNFRDNKEINKYNKGNYESNIKNYKKNKNNKEVEMPANDTENLLNKLFSSDEKKTEMKNVENEMKFVKVDIDKLFS